MDLTVTNSDTNNVGIFFRNGNDEFSEQKIFSTKIRSRPNSVAAGYFNGDLLLDTVVGNSRTNSTGVFLNMGNESFAIQMTYILPDASPCFVSVGDID